MMIMLMVKPCDIDQGRSAEVLMIMKTRRGHHHQQYDGVVLVTCVFSIDKVYRACSLMMLFDSTGSYHAIGRCI